ncbi:ATP-grasp domain-containing protein [Streptomyces sp. DSM 44915]|uniref:ATP-grasp domain-containing protein n=1 Tax=Streptomyces chisholmiae TaxID=3075540 RepID=A0ABU2JII2_9ACTN|nr:ATP-grasp domain-containing protein [Streptomyces sp. DSM 44915]MDT0264795.1 ATP-grasp domain-containing protein [Streptomyces sp. DSM 44915]
MSQVLFCRDPLNPRRVDAHFAPEAEAVRELGGTVALLDHDALLAGDARDAVARVPRDLGPVWYRGWMIPEQRYAELATALAARGTPLRVSADEYRCAHELPYWYPEFEAVTAASRWLAAEPGEVPTAEELARLASTLPAGPGVVKDWVKSRKHEWDTAAYVPDLADTPGLRRVVARMMELQDEFLAGGVALRAWEHYTGPEVRVWWLAGEPVLHTPHPDAADPAVPTPPLDQLRDPVARLGCPFITTDVARRADGTWRLIEVGDAQVSDRHPSVPPRALATLLLTPPTDG